MRLLSETLRRGQRSTLSRLSDQHHGGVATLQHVLARTAVSCLHSLLLQVILRSHLASV